MLQRSTDSNVKSLWKAISVIKCFAPNTLELSVADIAKRGGIPKPTVHRLISTLIKGGFIEKNANTGKYRIGVDLYTQGSLYLSSTDTLKLAEPVMKTLNELTGEAINLAVLDKSNIVFIMKEETKGAFRFFRHIGSVLPAYASAMGKALLSELTESEIDDLFPDERLQPLTKKTIATKTELKRELEHIRKTGYSIDIEGNTEGAMGIASSIRNASGRAVAAMSITIPVSKMNQYNCENLAALIRPASSLVSYRLGYQDSTNPVRDIKDLISWWREKKPDIVKYPN